MCLMVYLGLDHALTGFSDPPVGAIGLNPHPQPRPTALAHKSHVYGVAERVDAGWSCSCILMDQNLAYDPKELDLFRASVAAGTEAYASLADIVGAALRADARATLFSCWAGGEIDAPEAERTLAPAAFKFGNGVFYVAESSDPSGLSPLLIQLTNAEQAP